MGRTIAVDLDGVIHDYEHPLKGKKMGGPIEGTQDALKRLKGLGWKIIVFSVWGDQKKTIGDFMEYYHLPYDEITNQKPVADIYLDDKAVRFTSWKDVWSSIL
jgi:ribonucleotide monophosphatase NagD (HAD superfamily)